MNDQNDQALNGEEQTIPTESPEVEEKVVGEVNENETQVDSAESAETEDSQTETTEVAPKKGYQARVQELANKAKAAEERAKSLEERIAELTGSVEPPAEYQPYVPQVEPGGEVSPEQYRNDVTRTADAIVTLKLKQNEAIQKINSDSAKVMKIYPELDPDSDNFNKELSESITEAVEAHVKASPYTASVEKFVHKLMKPYKGAVETEVGKARENITKQVSQTALRPTSVSKPEKTANEKSIAELESELGIVQA